MIELAGGYYAKADHCQYMVGKLITGKDGKARIKNPQYFLTMLQAVKYAAREILREKAAGDEITTLKDFLREAEALQKDFARKLEGLEV